MFRPFKIKTLLFLAIFQSCNSDGISDAISEPTFQFKWAKLLSGPTNEDEIDAVASDSQGNVYVSGKYEQDLKIEGQSTPIEATGNKADIMIVKYNKEGIWQWTRNFGSTGEDNIFDAVCDVQGNLILSGYFEGTVAFGDFELTSQAGLDMVLLKISPDGTVLKAIALGGNGDDGGNEVAIGNDNEIIVGAQSNGTFEGIPNTGNVDAYIMSFTNDLVLNWVRAIKGGGDARAKAVEVDDNGNVYLGGDYRNANSVDVNGTSKSFENFGGTDAFIASWTSSGVFRWVENFGGVGDDLCKGIGATSQNKIYAVGQFSGAASFAETFLVSINGSQDLFVWKLNDQGTSEWIRHIKAIKNLTGAEITTDNKDNLYFGLGISGIVEFQTTDSDFIDVTSCGGQNCPILIKYSPNGNFLNSIQAGQSDNSRFGEIAFSDNIIFIDCTITGGPNVFGSAILESQNQTKDASIIAINVN